MNWSDDGHLDYLASTHAIKWHPQLGVLHNSLLNIYHNALYRRTAIWISSINYRRHKHYCLEQRPTNSSIYLSWGDLSSFQIAPPPI